MRLLNLTRWLWAVRTWWIFGSMVVITGACNEEDSPVSDIQYTGTARPVGSTLGATETFTVGPDGATIASADGRIEISIPEGAVTTSTTFGIQAIENTAPNAVGGAYRITPHSVAFQKPVKLSFTYEEDSVSFENGMGLAYQGDNGVWYWPGTFSHQKDLNKLTVETSHFSDWSIFESIKILPAHASIEPDGEVTLTAHGTFPADVHDDDDLLTPLTDGEDLLTPLVPREVMPLAEPQPIDIKYIDQWILQGEGSLTPSGNSATYKSPSAVPDVNPVTIYLKLKLKTGQPFILTSRISIGASTIMLTGGPYSNETFTGNKPGAALYDPVENLTSIYVLLLRSDGASVGITLSFHGNTAGQEAWNEPDCFVYTSHTTTASNRAIVGTYYTYNDSDQEIHPGYIKIDRYAGVGGTIAGSFQGNFTFMDSNCDYCKSYGTIAGNFTAIRLQ